MPTPIKNWQFQKMDLSGLPKSPTKLHYWSQLLPNQRRFVDEYVVCMNPADAAKRAGYQNPYTVWTTLVKSVKIRCAIRERLETVSELSSISAADIRRDLKLIHEADATELTGIWKVPCRHCYGDNHQFQYTNAEMYYLERAHSYGEEDWPSACVTDDFGPILKNHAIAAYHAGKKHLDFDLKGGNGYTRVRDINPECPQCDGQGIPMPYICDTRHLSEGARRMFKAVKMTGGDKIELLMIDRDVVRQMLARDTMVGIERKELKIELPRTPEEFARIVKQMPVEELEQFVANMITLDEGEYHHVVDAALPKPNRFSRGN